MEPDDALAINRAGWNAVAPWFYGRTALPTYGPLAPTEDTLHLLGSLAGTRVLELGCGSGHSLLYAARHGAAEVWGLDLSSTQIAFAEDLLRDAQVPARLFLSPMERDPGIPTDYFDVVFSIYGLGWTTDLPATLTLVARYLKPGGVFVCSGEHPAYSCLEYDAGRYVVARPYATEGPNRHESWNGTPIVIQQRTLGTFINEAVRAGLVIDAVVECALDPTFATEPQHDPARWYSIPRARLMPTTFVLQAHRPAAGARTA